MGIKATIANTLAFYFAGSRFSLRAVSGCIAEMVKADEMANVTNAVSEMEYRNFLAWNEIAEETKSDEDAAFRCVMNLWDRARKDNVSDDKIIRDQYARANRRENEIVRLEDRLSEMARSVNIWHSIATELANTVDDQKAKLARNETEIAKLDRDVTYNRNHLEMWRGIAKDKTNTIRIYGDVMDNRAEEIKSLRLELQDARDEIAGFKTDLATMADDNRNLTRELDETIYAQLDAETFEMTHDEFESDMSEIPF